MIRLLIFVFAFSAASCSGDYLVCVSEIANDPLCILNKNPHKFQLDSVFLNHKPITERAFVLIPYLGNQLKIKLVDPSFVKKVNPGDELKIRLKTEPQNMKWFHSIWYKIRPSQYSSETIVKLTQCFPPECDSIIKIVYNKIDDIINQSIIEEGIINENEVSINDLLDRLLSNSLLQTLSKDTTLYGSTCFKNYDILKWLNEENAIAFESGRYRLNNNLRSILDRISERIKENAQNKK